MTKVSAVSSTVAMLGAPRSGSGSVHRRRHDTPRGCVPPGADRCGTPAPPHIIPIRHDGDVPHTLTDSPRRRARRRLGRRAAGRHGIPRRRLPQRRTAHRGRCCTTPPLPPPTPPTGCRPRTPPSRGPCATPPTSPPASTVRSLVDVGGGTGAASWAAAEAFPALERVEVLDGSADALALGARIGRRRRRRPSPTATWTRMLLGPGVTAAPGRPRAVVSYLLGELPEPLHAPLVDAALAAAATAVLVVEPGTPRGYAAVLGGALPAHRRGVARAGALPAGRCRARWPPARATGATSRRGSTAPRCTAGSRAAALGHEDEKFSYVLATRTPRGAARGPGAAASGHPQGPGAARGLRRRRGPRERVVVTKRDPIAYRAARDASWGSPGQSGRTPARRGPLIASK